MKCDGFSPSFVVVYGCPRSGTTFLMNALAAARATETITGLIFPAVLPHILDSGVSFQIDKAIRLSLRTSLEQYWARISASRGWAALELLRRNRSIREFTADMRRRHSTRFLVFKEPYLAFAPELAELGSPRTRAIYLVRDGRDCALSLVRTYNVLSNDSLRSLSTREAPLGRPREGLYIPWWVPPSDDEAFLAASQFERAARMWAHLVKRNLAYQSTLEESDRVLIVRYEDLMQGPIEVGREVAAHIGVQLGREAERRLLTAHGKSIGSHASSGLPDIDRVSDLLRPQLKAHGYIA